MPYISCLFASASDPMLAALREDPDCRHRLHRFREVEGLDLSGKEILVVHLQGSVGAPWPDVREGYSPMTREAWYGPLPSGILTPPFDTHGWLFDALPPPGAIDRWSRIAEVTGERLALWWWWERGDNLYSDIAWLFSPEGATLLVRETTEVGNEERTFQYPPPPEGAPIEEVPLHAAMKHLGFQSSLQYFVPTDNWHFDWAPYRLSAQDIAAIEKMVRAAEERVFAAIKARDIEALGREIAADFVLSAPNKPDQGREDFLQAIASMPYRILEVDGEDIHFRLLGDVAILTGVQRARVEVAPDNIVVARTAFTDLFTREGDSFQLRHAFGVELPDPGST